MSLNYVPIPEILYHHPEVTKFDQLVFVSAILIQETILKRPFLNNEDYQLIQQELKQDYKKKITIKRIKQSLKKLTDLKFMEAHDETTIELRRGRTTSFTND